MGDVLEDRFVLEDRVSRGGSGIVYRGWDLETDTAVAVKVLRQLTPSETVRFARESSLLAEAGVDGVVRYVAHGSMGDNAWFLVTEWLAGETLAQRLSSRGLTLVETIALGRAICGPLASLHARGLIHRDLKPANLVFTGSAAADVKLIDFGLARIAGDFTERITETGAVLGTPGYMAPEQARGEREIGPAADVFAVGCVLYECIAGVPPFAGANMMAVLYKILVADPPPLRRLNPACPPAVEAAIARMLAKQPADRPADGAALGDLLRGVGPVPDAAPRPDAVSAVATWREQTAVTTGVDGLLVIEPVDPATTDAIVAALPSVAHCERLLGGGLVVTIPGEPDQLLALADLALALRARTPELRIALGTDAELSTLVDRTAGMLEHTLRVASFASETDGRIAIDPRTVPLLAEAFAVEESALGWVLRGRRTPG